MHFYFLQKQHEIGVLFTLRKIIPGVILLRGSQKACLIVIVISIHLCDNNNKERK